MAALPRRGRNEIARLNAIVAGAKAAAARDLLSFMRWCWASPSPFVVGRHTRAICARLTRAVEDWRRGKSTYLIIKVPFRHGKSEICSIHLPAWFVGRNADRQPSAILTGYGASLVHGFSAKARRLVKGDAYREIFPGVELAKATDAEWSVAGSVGAVFAEGLEGSLTGKGGSLLVVDDYCRSRADAVSKTMRNKIWDAFRNDLFTRQNDDAAIVLVVATPWHVDDLIGRIAREHVENPAFPRFETLSFPARMPGPDGWEYLCPELKPPKWYDEQRAMLGRQAAALLDCSPRVEGGNRFDPDKVDYRKTLDGWPTVREVRGWDLASSSRERSSDDPDRTFGVRGGVTMERGPDGARVPHLWIRSMVCCRAEAPERNRLMRETATADGGGVTQCVEAFGAYKDAFTELKAALAGAAVVRPSRMPGDKSAKAAPLEPLFDAGNVHVYEPGCRAALGWWAEDFAAFPDGAHDDAVDATAICYAESSRTGSRFIL